MTDTSELRDVIRRELKMMDPELPETDPNWSYAAFLIASAACDCDPDEIASALGFDAAFVAVCAERAIQNHIWTDGRIRFADYQHEEFGGTQFWLDVAVIAGRMKRDLACRYMMTDSGRTEAMRLIGPKGE